MGIFLGLFFRGASIGLVGGASQVRGMEYGVGTGQPSQSSLHILVTPCSLQLG